MNIFQIIFATRNQVDQHHTTTNVNNLNITSILFITNIFFIYTVIEKSKYI